MKVPAVVSVASVLSALLFLAPLSVHAQRGMARVTRSYPMMRPAHVQRSDTHPIAVGHMRAATAAPGQFRHPSFGGPPASFGTAYAGGEGESLVQLLNPTPGLGFDYSYLNAINSDIGIKAVIDPETEWRLAVAERIARATGGYAAGGYYLLDGGDYIVPAQPGADQPQESAQPQQPTVIVLQQQEKPQTAAGNAPAVVPQPATPLPNISNFTLVLRNGTKIQAIAFTREGDKIVYITADGSRHAIPASELNSSATEQLNADSGTQLRL